MPAMIMQKKNANHANHASSRSQEFLMLLLTGFFIIFAGIIILLVAAVIAGGSVDFGALVIIMPFPLVIAAGLEATWIVLFAVILAVLSLIMFPILHKEVEKTNV